ncbi:hypothetical protein [Mycobacterium kyogaense]|uniref:hypothetical protein n=1 Tax=Mycobacterium kyogaense TaxID=2212479 RepID=UPI002FFA50C4
MATGGHGRRRGDRPDRRVLADTPPLASALSGLAATAYLVTRHDAATVPTMSCAVGFAATAALVLAVPVELPWIPLAAPLVLLAAYLLAVRPFVAREH